MCILTWDLILNITLPGTQPCFCAQRGETELGKGLENKFSEKQLRELGGLFQPQWFCKIKAENPSNPCKSCSPGCEPTPSPAQWARHRGVVQHLALHVGRAQCSLRQTNLALTLELSKLFNRSTSHQVRIWKVGGPEQFCSPFQNKLDPSDYTSNVVSCSANGSHAQKSVPRTICHC